MKYIYRPKVMETEDGEKHYIYCDKDKGEEDSKCKKCKFFDGNKCKGTTILTEYEYWRKFWEADNETSR